MASLHFNSNHNEDWNECALQEINEYDLATTPLQLQDCWSCPLCGRINNLTRTMSTPGLLCLHCQKGKYIPGKTKVISKSSCDSKYLYKIANEPEKKLLKEGIIKRIKVWMCLFCKKENCMFDLTCCLCKTTRAPNPTSYYKNEIAKWICYDCGSEVLNASKCCNCLVDINPPILDWQCKNCENIHIKMKKTKKIYKCSKCGFPKPLSFDWKTYKHSMNQLIDGYCKESLYDLPFYLVDIIKMHYIEIIPEDELEKALITDREKGVYIWHYKIHEIEGHNGTPGVDIGLKEVNDENEQDIEYILNDVSRQNKKYCQKIEKNDVVTMELNYLTGTLSFGINNEWFGTFENINNEKKIYITITLCRSKNRIIEN